MSNPIQDIEGIGPAFAEKLSAAGIKTTDALLEKACTAKGRQGLASECDIPEKQILKWANHADLFRIKGIGGEFAELLESAGVDTVKELATRKPENLAAKMAEVNQEKKLTRAVPSATVVAGWVDQAKTLPPKIEH